MYFPYLRGKQFELQSLAHISPAVYKNTIPILEPVAMPQGKVYTRVYQELAQKDYPLLLVLNPYHPQARRLSIANVQSIVDNDLGALSNLYLGFLIDIRFSIADLTAFLKSNKDKKKAIIFRYNPLPADLTLIQNEINKYPVEFIVFDDKKTDGATRTFFNAQPKRVLITDGFQRQDANSLYPAASTFASNYLTWKVNGWFGIGDYETIGDFFQDGGGQALVIALHLTTQTPAGLIVHHFASTYRKTIAGFAPAKFKEACKLLVNSPAIAGLSSSGLTLFKNWEANAHNPHLGHAKQASVMHHIELLSSII